MIEMAREWLLTALQIAGAGWISWQVIRLFLLWEGR